MKQGRKGVWVMVIYPDYYPSFKCKAGACKHSCCIGWEIDVDAETLQHYRHIKGELGVRLQQKIEWEADAPHFILDSNERCPFLNEKGLCDLILAGGESLLCQICADHPRFRNFYSDRVEIGVGLCCEAAGRLILENQEKVCLLTEGLPKEAVSDEEETAFGLWRDGLMQIAQDRSLSIQERLAKLMQAAGASIEFLPHKWLETYMHLESLEKEWIKRLEGLMTLGESVGVPLDDSKWEVPLEQLLVYFLYRHLAGALDDGRYQERLVFSLLSVTMICWLLAAEIAASGGADMASLIEIARQYSAEIEYSQENLETLWQAVALEMGIFEED